MVYEILDVTEEERMKAEKDWNYSPEEHVVVEIECKEWEIENKVRKLYPGMQYREKAC